MHRSVRCLAEPLDATAADVMIRAGTGVRDVLVNRATGVAVNELAAKSVAELGGHLIPRTRPRWSRCASWRTTRNFVSGMPRSRSLVRRWCRPSVQAMNKRREATGKGLGPTLRQATTQTDAKFALDGRGS